MKDLEKRGRGRPKGTTIREDETRLVKVADAVVKDPSLKATTAIKRVLHAEGLGEAKMAAAVRRLQGKWKERHADLRAAATRRQEARDTEHVPYFGSLGLARYPGESIGEIAARIHREAIDQRARDALLQYEHLLDPVSEALREHDKFMRDQMLQYKDLGRSSATEQLSEAVRHFDEQMRYSGLDEAIRQAQATLDPLGYRSGRWW